MSQETIDQAEIIGMNYANGQLDRLMGEIDVLNGQIVSKEELQDLLVKANEWVDFIAGDDRKLYRTFRFRMFKDVRPDGFVSYEVKQGEIDTDP